jgi:hypothetical protein
MSALKQVLNRRLFRHGGMLGPEDPQGILNSSDELANVVRMQNGGFNTLRGTINIDNPRGIPVGNMPQYRPGEMGSIYEAPPVPPPIPGITTALQRRSVETPFGKTSIPDLAAETKDPALRVKRQFRPEEIPWVDMWEGASLGERLQNLGGNVAENIRVGAQHFGEEITDLTQDVLDRVADTELEGTIPIHLREAINDLKRDAPIEIAAEIENAAVGVIDRVRQDTGKNPFPDELKQKIGDIIYSTVELPSLKQRLEGPPGPTVAERIEAEGMAIQPTEGRGLGVVRDELVTGIVDLIAPELDYDPNAGAPVVIEDLTAVVDGPTPGAVEGLLRGGKEDIVVKEEDGQAQAQDQDQAVGAPVVIEDPTAVVEDPTAVVEEPNAIDAIAGVLSDPGQPMEEKEKTIDEYKQEFIDALPGYEGKTQFEKGMDLATFGAAIMAGRSQHAIQNIGDAFLAMGDRFTTDDKERRAYNSVIKFSGAKYGMERVNKLRDEQRESERELLSYKNITDKDIMINGSRVAAGDWTLLSKDHLLREGLPPGFKSESLYIEESKAAVTRFTQMRTLLKESAEVGMLTEPETKRLTKTYKDNIDNIQRSNGIINDIVTLRRFLKDNPGKITSWTSLGSAGKDAFLNALGISPETGEMTREQFLGMTSTALNKGIPVALRENQSANSISNFDVRTFAKGYFDGLGIPEDGTIAFKQIFKNPEVLYTKLGEFYGQLENKRDGSLVELRTVDNELLGRKMPGISEIGGGIYQVPIYRSGSELTRPYREGRPWEQEVVPLLRLEEGQSSGLVFNRETGVYDIVKRSPYPS